MLSHVCGCHPQGPSIGQASLVLAPANFQTSLGLSGTPGEGEPAFLISLLLPVISI